MRMKCPYCEDEMEVGCIRSGNPMIWYATPGDCEIPFNMRDPKGKKVSWGEQYRLTAHYCKHCGLLLAEPRMEPRGLEHSIERGKAQARKLYKRLKKEDF